ncbi:hypothetical protein GCM10009767_35340 [Kocuria aegyptia]|uniref:DNA-binding protein n=1 Tax=Kocuria aegyptia TaxID=330943 RepID=A0ABP4XAT5_9MICC
MPHIRRSVQAHGAPEEYPTPAQAAERLGGGAEHICVLCRIGPEHGGLRSVKGRGPNGHVRESAITAWVEGNTCTRGHDSDD